MKIIVWRNKYNFFNDSKQFFSIAPIFQMACHLCRVNWLEITGFICGILGIYLTLKENAWCFPIGLINVILSLYLFYEQQLYADAMQQIVYTILLTYGWYKWLHGAKLSEHLKINKSSSTVLIVSFFSWLAGTVLLGFLLENYTNAATPWPDSAATMLSFIAQWMVAKKKIENWLLWLVVNITYIGIYLYKGLPFYALLFAVYFCLAIWGYNQWKKEMKLDEAV